MTLAATASSGCGVPGPTIAGTLRRVCFAGRGEPGPSTRTIDSRTVFHIRTIV
ncbi:MAG: hypothetical protein WKF58_15875 [Ilumatobacteraceae bacterium]